jgi:hypothetical protein
MAAKWLTPAQWISRLPIVGNLKYQARMNPKEDQPFGYFPDGAAWPQVAALCHKQTLGCYFTLKARPIHADC